MHRLAIAVLAAFALPVAAADKSPLEGKWTITALTRDGQADKSLVGGVREHAGDAYTITPPAGSATPKVSGTAVIDAAKKTIDMMPGAGRYKGKTLKGIYKLDGDTLTVAFSGDPDKPRPTDFVSPPASGVVVAVHTKAK